MNYIVAIIIGCVAVAFTAHGMFRYLDGIEINKRLLKNILRPSYGAELLPLLQILFGYLQITAAIFIWFW